MHLGCAVVRRQFGVHCGWQHIVVDFHEGCGIGCGGGTIGDYRDDRITNAPDLANRKRRMRDLDSVRHDPAARKANSPPLYPAPVRTATTPSAALAADVSMPVDVGVGVGAAHQCHVQHTHQLNVIYISASASYEARVLPSLDNWLRRRRME